jgi:hypothetical protein
LLGERAGDDDLFVNKVANKHNTAVVCTKDSVVWSVPKVVWKDWFRQKRRHLSVSPHYNWWSKVRLVLEPMSRGIMYILLILLMLAGGVSCWAGLLLFGIRMLVQLLVVNLSAKHLGLRAYGLEVIFYDIALPLINLHILCTQPFHKRRMCW